MEKIKKEKPIFKVIDAGIFPFDILFTIGSTEEEIIKYLENKCNYKLDDQEKKHIDIKGKGGRTVRFKNNSLLCWTKKKHIPIIAHEVFHVAELVMGITRTPLNDDTSESYAYLIEFLWRQINCLLEHK